VIDAVSNNTLERQRACWRRVSAPCQCS
jgi:hypothetical protein